MLNVKQYILDYAVNKKLLTIGYVSGGPMVIGLIAIPGKPKWFVHKSHVVYKRDQFDVNNKKILNKNEDFDYTKPQCN